MPTKLLLVLVTLAAQAGSTGAAGTESPFTGVPDSEELLIRLVIDGTVSRSFIATIELGDTLDDLKQRVAESEGLLHSRQHFFMPSGEQIPDDANSRPMSEYGIGAAGGWLTLRLDTADSRHATNLTVVTLAGERLAFSLELGQSVASLKEMIAMERASMPADQQRLLIKGKALRNERSLNEYAIWNGTELHLGRPLDGARRKRAVTIFVKILNGATIAIERVDLTETVARLKERIEGQTGAVRQVQILLFNTTELHDANLLYDHGLDQGSSVYMLLHSRLVQSPARVQEIVVVRGQPAAPAAGQHNRGPVLHESTASTTTTSIMRDERVWLFAWPARDYFEGMMNLFEPLVGLVPNPDNPGAIEESRKMLDRMAQSDNTHPGLYGSLRARLQMASILRQYRAKGGIPRRPAGIDLMRSGAESGREGRHESMGVNLGNYAPDTLPDSDLTYLFEFLERVRAQLESDARTGQTNLDPAKLRLLNTVVFRAYTDSLAGFPLAQVGYQPEEGADEECSMCRDELALEPALKLAGCGHTFHTDCAVQWLPQMYRQYEYSSCAYCREPFGLRLETALEGVWPS